MQNGLVRAKELVLAEWQKTLFLRNESPETRGWLLDVMKCVESLGKRDFTLDEVYAFERHLGELYPKSNSFVGVKTMSLHQYLMSDAKPRQLLLMGAVVGLANGVLVHGPDASGDFVVAADLPW